MIGDTNEDIPQFLTGDAKEDLQPAIEKVFETFTRHMLSESEPYKNMTNRELGALAAAEVVALIKEKK